jgi:hypothetical protein
MKRSMQTYTFTLILADVPGLTDAVCDALFEAGCDDALVGMRDGVVFLDYSREAGSFREAVFSAIADVEGAGIEAHVARVEPDELVTMSEIARRTGRSRENVRQLISGVRGPGGFPPPVANLTRKSPIWRWTEAAQWFREKAGVEAAASTEEAATKSSTCLDGGDFIAAVNATLELRRHVPTPGEAMQLYEKLLQPSPRSRKRQRQKVPAQRD